MSHRIKTILPVVMIFVFSGALAYSIFGIINWQQDSSATQDIVEEVQEIATTPDDPEPNNDDPAESEPTPTYELNFPKLLTINSQTIGWISVPGTNIDYPYVQTDNNDYYLTHSFDYTPNSAGWVFMDYRNKSDFSHKNTIIYAHGRYDKTMFGSLSTLLNKSWKANLNKNITTLTPTGSYIWEVFSVYHIPTTSDYLRINFSGDKDFTDFINTLKSRSAYDLGVSMSATDRILTLSTCYNKSEKLVVHAKLISN